MQEKTFHSSTKALDTVLSYVPKKVSDAIIEHLEITGTDAKMIGEIRIRSPGLCAAVIGGENVTLEGGIGDDELKETFKRICGGAIYSHRDDISRGFVALPHGVRVGIIGHARYERDSVVGVSDISSLVFRIPSGECSFGRRLYTQWLMSPVGMLVCARAGGGKTTAIRTLARLIGSGERPRRVVVVDERCEFDSSEYIGAHVDIMRGYRRALGVGIALRTMSAEVLIVDEISNAEDSRAMLDAIGAGVTVIATAHAESIDDAMRRHKAGRRIPIP